MSLDEGLRMRIGDEITLNDGSIMLKTQDGVERYDRDERAEYHVARKNVDNWLKEHGEV